MKKVIPAAFFLVLLGMSPAFSADAGSNGALVTNLEGEKVQATLAAESWYPSIGEILLPKTLVTVPLSNQIELIHLQTNQNATVIGSSGFSVEENGFKGSNLMLSPAPEELKSKLLFDDRALSELCAVSSDHISRGIENEKTQLVAEKPASPPNTSTDVGVNDGEQTSPPTSEPGNNENYSDGGSGTGQHKEVQPVSGGSRSGGPDIQLSPVVPGAPRREEQPSLPVFRIAIPADSFGTAKIHKVQLHEKFPTSLRKFDGVGTRPFEIASGTGWAKGAIQVPVSTETVSIELSLPGNPDAKIVVKVSPTSGKDQSRLLWAYKLAEEGSPEQGAALILDLLNEKKLSLKVAGFHLLRLKTKIQKGTGKK